MRIHNLMEEIVLHIVNEMCDEKAKCGDSTNGTSELCRFDIACFVLNRIPPKYVTSGRGLAHVEISMKDHQLVADITSLANEGLRRVNVCQRPYYAGGISEKIHEEKGPFFNFPAIKGRLFYGDTFEPVKDVEISLFMDNKLVEMTNSRWQNPYYISEGAPGTFTFWAASMRAQKNQKSKVFHFQLTTPENEYDGLNHFFEISCETEEHAAESVALPKAYTIEDLYLFPKG